MEGLPDKRKKRPDIPVKYINRQAAPNEAAFL